MGPIFADLVTLVQDHVEILSECAQLDSSKQATQIDGCMTRGAGSVYSTVEQGDGDIPMEDGKTVHGGTIGL